MTTEDYADVALATLRCLFMCADLCWEVRVAPGEPTAVVLRAHTRKRPVRVLDFPVAVPVRYFELLNAADAVGYLEQLVGPYIKRMRKVA